MKGKGHSELRGTTDYYISKNKIAHTEKCRYAKSIKQPIKTHAIRLLRDGCKLCKICDPLTFHEQVVRSWEPNINIYIQHAKYSLQQELVAFLENKVNKTNSMSASESIYRKW